MRVLFTRSDSLLSRMIRYLTGEPVSHVAILLDPFVIHSDLRGVNITLLHEFSEGTREIVYSVEVPTTYRISTAPIRSFYDYGALLYLALRYILSRYTPIHIPKANLWAASGLYTCTELVTYILDGKEDSLITPYQLYEKLSNRKDNL